MASKRYNAEEIIHKLREADALLSQGKSVGEVCKKSGLPIKPIIGGVNPMEV